MKNLSGIVDNKDIVTKDYIPTKTSDLSNDSGFITGMTILSYGSSTWDDFIAAYNAKKVVYCRASSNLNPASGSQTRLAFMAYVNSADTPTNVEFQYYRSVNSHTASQQGDQVFVYKLDKTAGWTVTTREASVKINISNNNEGIETTYSSGVVTIGHANAITAQTTSGVYPIKIDAQGHISEYGNAVTIPSTANDVGAVATTSVGAANGVVPLDSNSLIDEQYLPSYVDDVIEGYYYNGDFYEDSSHTIVIVGETGKIYIDLTGNKSYRWSGSVFVEITSGGHTYTAGSGIDISSGDVISVDTNDIQEKLVSGTNIKTVNNNSLLGSGNIDIVAGVSDVEVDGSSVVTSGVAEIDLSGKQNTLVSGTNIKTVNNTSLLGSGNIDVEGVPHVNLTQAQYDALSSSEKNNGTIYFITDGQPSIILSGGTIIDVQVNDSSVVLGGIAKIDLTGKQDNLISGTNIKTINNISLLGSGNLTPVDIGAQPQITYGTTDLTPGVSSLTTGNIYVVYE